VNSTMWYSGMGCPKGRRRLQAAPEMAVMPFQGVEG
jgi:hypothetical protein